MVVLLFGAVIAVVAAIAIAFAVIAAIVIAFAVAAIVIAFAIVAVSEVVVNVFQRLALAGQARRPALGKRRQAVDPAVLAVLAAKHQSCC